MTAKMTLMLLLVLLPLASTVGLAQDTPTTAANSTTTTAPTGSTKVTLGPLARVTDWSYADGQFTVVVEAKASVPLTVSTPPGKGSSGEMRYVEKRLSKGTNEFTVEVAASGRPTLVFTTPGLKNQGKAKFIRASQRGFISGPWDGSDVRDAGIGAALGVALTVLLTVVKAKRGASNAAERLA